jgi:hypothetical protein
MAEQLPLGYEADYRDRQERKTLVGLFKDAVLSVGAKVVEGEAEIPRSTLNAQINLQDDREPGLRLLVYLLRKGKGLDILRRLAAIAGARVVIDPPTPAEELRRLRAALDKNPSVAKAIYEEAELL